MIKQFFLTLFLFSNLLYAQDNPLEILKNNLDKHNFICSKNIQYQSVNKCVGSIQEYPKRITLFFSDELETINHLQLHFHGWLLRYQSGELTQSKNYSTDLNALPYAQHISKNKNSILIVPESENKELTFIQTFTTATYFEKFMSAISLLTTNTENLTLQNGIEISGHSGAYIPLGLIAKFANNNLNSFYLAQINKFSMYDATYDSPINGTYSKAVFNWIKLNNKNLLTIHYVSSSNTTKGALEFKTLATNQNILNQVNIKPYLNMAHDVAYYKSLPTKYRMKHFTLLWDRF